MNIKYNVIALIFACSNMSYAKQIQEISSDVENINIIGTRLGNTPIGALSVLSRSDIEQINSSATIDLLRRIPHLDIAENGNAGGFTYVSLRGGEFNFTLVTIDGVAVNDSTNSRGGGFDFNQIHPSAIDRIEVYRGGVNAIYGGEAISGVVNIVTRDRTDPVFFVEVGNHRQFNTSYVGSKELNENASLLTSFSSLNKRVSSFQQIKSQQAMSKFSAKYNKAHYSLMLAFNDVDVSGFTEDSGGPLFAQPQSEETRDSRQWLVNSSGHWQIDDKLSTQVEFSFLKRNEIIDNPGIVDGVFSGIPASVVRSEYNRVEFDGFANYSVDKDTKIILGSNLRKQRGVNIGTLDFGFLLPVDYDFSQKTYAIFSEVRHSIDSVMLEAGFRYDDADEFDSENSFRIGASYSPSFDTRVFAVFNQGHKLPSFFALAHPLVGNSELLPEISDNYEIGFESIFNQDIGYSVVYFANQFENLVDFDSELFTNVNRNTVNASGLEFDINASLGRDLNFTFNARYLDIDADLGVTLRKRPNLSGNIRLDWRNHLMHSSVFVDFRDNFLDSSIATGFVRLGGHAILGVSNTYSYSKQLQFTLNIENALGKSIEDAVGFVQNDIEARVGLSYVL